METTSTRTSRPNKPSSIIEERKMPCAPSVAHVPSLVRVAASRVITRMRRMEAISPTTRKGSVTRTCERMEIGTVCRICGAKEEPRAPKGLCGDFLRSGFRKRAIEGESAGAFDYQNQANSDG